MRICAAPWRSASTARPSSTFSARGRARSAEEPPPGGLWGMPPDQVTTLPGYDPDVRKNRDQARQIMQKFGYGPDKPLNIKVTTRAWFVYRDPAVLLIDQLKHVYINGE